MITKKHCFNYGCKVSTQIPVFEAPKNRQLKIPITARH